MPGPLSIVARIFLHKLKFEFASKKTDDTPIQYSFSFPVGTNLSGINLNSPEMILKRSDTVVRSFSGKQGIFLVENGLLRWIPNMDTLAYLGFSMGSVVYTSDEFIDTAIKGAPVPACQNCRR